MTKAPGKKEYRDFAWIVGGVLALLFGLFFPWLKSHEPRWWLIGVGGLLAAVGTVFPQYLGPLYRAWMKVGHVLGRVNTFILLHLVFYCIFTPMAFLLRLARWKSPVKEKPCPVAATYRATAAAQTKERMEEIF